MIPKSLLAAAAAVLIVTAAASHAEDAPARPEGGDDSISLELNKLESSDKGCKAYVVASNPTTTSYDALRLDLVMFQTDGVIGRRFALELAPLRPSRTVKMFEPTAPSAKARQLSSTKSWNANPRRSGFDCLSASRSTR
jgi:hypothetical protein